MGGRHEVPPAHLSVDNYNLYRVPHATIISTKVTSSRDHETRLVVPATGRFSYSLKMCEGESWWPVGAWHLPATSLFLPTTLLPCMDAIRLRALSHHYYVVLQWVFLLRGASYLPDTD